jgi:hypothetical protein
MASFPNHAGMPHPGMAHAQMGPQQVHHPGQAMGQQMMHPGVSGPGGPMVSQAGQMMGGMQPGMAGPGGPNSVAIQHLNPGGQHMGQPPNMQCKWHVLRLMEPILCSAVVFQTLVVLLAYD